MGFQQKELSDKRGDSVCSVCFRRSGGKRRIFGGIETGTGSKDVGHRQWDWGKRFSSLKSKPKPGVEVHLQIRIQHVTRLHAYQWFVTIFTLYRLKNKC